MARIFNVRDIKGALSRRAAEPQEAPVEESPAATPGPPAEPGSSSANSPTPPAKAGRQSLVQVVDDLARVGELDFDKLPTAYSSAPAPTSSKQATQAAEALAGSEAALEAEPSLPERVAAQEGALADSIPEQAEAAPSAQERQEEAPKYLQGELTATETQIDMAGVNASLEELMKVEGAMAGAVVDMESGMALGTIGSGFPLGVAAAGSSEVVRSKQKIIKGLGLHDSIDDILITLSSQYHLIRPLKSAPNLFIYLVLDRTQANLAMARFKLSAVEGSLEV